VTGAGASIKCAIQRHSGEGPESMSTDAADSPGPCSWDPGPRRDDEGTTVVEPQAASAYAEVMTVHFHEEDLPQGVLAPGPVAVDTEAMGLLPGRDRLCVVQVADGRGDEHLVRFNPGSDYSAPNLKAVLADPDRLKLYHFARFDLAIMQAYLGVMAGPVYCTKTASRLIRTYTDRHGLKELIKELLQIDISKQQQTSDWGAPDLSDAQKDYAASDVRYLHQMKEKLDERLEREGRMKLAQACFDFLPHRALLDLAGWAEVDIFAHV
jgi:ribonuclease D